MTKRIWLTALATLTFILAMLCGYGLRAQEAIPEATPVPPADAVPVAPLPGSATEYNPPIPSPSPTVMPIVPTAMPTVSPTASPSPSPIPVTPLPAATPLPTAGEFIDPGGRFRVAILQDYRVTAIGDAVLIERQDGTLAYTALAQPVVGGGLIAPESLAEIAKTVFQRGEGFTPGATQPIPGGVQIDWNGSLTIGGKPQLVNGLIVAKPTGVNVLLLLIAATESEAETVPNAAAALIDSLQAM